MPYCWISSNRTSTYLVTINLLEMTNRNETFRNCGTAIPLSSLKILNLYVIASSIYGSPDELNWVCEVCTSKSDRIYVAIGVGIRCLYWKW